MNYYDLSDFAKGYVEAMFFTDGDMGNDDRTLGTLGTDRLTRAAIKQIKSDCDSFTGTIMPDGCYAQQWIDRLTGTYEAPRYGDGVSDERRAGHMFWYARQGHGVAWTDDYASGDDAGYDVANGLQKASQAFGECYVEVSRGWIYVR